MESASQVQSLLDQGLSGAEIARRLGVSHSKVSRIAARLGRPLGATRGSKFDWAPIRAYYKAGHTVGQCRERFGLSTGAWDRAVTRGDILPRPRSSQHAPGRRRRQVAELLEQGLSVAEVARRLEVSKQTVCYHARKLGVPPDTRFSKRVNWASVQVAYDKGMSVRECALKFGFNKGSWHQAVKRGVIQPRDRRIPLEELLVVGRSTTRTHLKARLVAAGLKENRCERCGIAKWRGKPLSMQLHHRNGDGLDNRLPNLEFLCANCHSQTENWGGRNRHRNRLKAA